MTEIVYCLDCDEEYRNDELIIALHSSYGLVCPICGGYNFENFEQEDGKKIY